MKILFVSDVYFPRVNGVSTSIRTFRQDLATCGVDTLLVVRVMTNPRPRTNAPMTSRGFCAWLPPGYLKILKTAACDGVL
jgi:hypothetical protein